MILIENLIYEYPQKRVLKNISFSIPRGAVCALVGPNGAGKSTLLRCIAGLDLPLSGSVRVHGIDVIDNPRLAHTFMGFLPDDFGLYDQLTVRQALLFIARSHNIPENDLQSRIAEVADKTRLHDLLDQRGGTLSRGQRQRVGLAKAIMNRPPVLLLDEPASGLDPDARIHISQLMKVLAKDGTTILVSSHILAELEDYCTSMLVIKDGQILDHVGIGEDMGRKADSIEMEIRAIETADFVLSVLKSQITPANPRIEQDLIVFDVDGEDKLPALLRLLLERGVNVTHFAQRERKLQDHYKHIAGVRSLS